MANIVKETKRDLKFRISKKHSFSLSKRLLKSLTTNQLLLLLPTIIEKIIRNNNVHIIDKHSDQTDFSIPTSEDCFKSSKNSIKVQNKGVSLTTNSKPDKSQRNWFSLPMFSKDCKTICSDSLTFKNESVKTFESLFNDITVTDHSKDSTMKKFKRYTKRLCHKYRRELSETTGNFQSVSDANTNCQKQSFLMDQSYCFDFLPQEYEKYDSSIAKSKVSKLAIDVNEISTIDFEEYVEVIHSEEFSFIDICLEKSNEKLSKNSIICHRIYTGQLIKCSNRHTNSISTINDVYNIQFNSSVENNFTNSMNSVFNNLLEQKSNQLDSNNSLEVRVDVCEDQSTNFNQTTSPKSMESLDTIINNYAHVLNDDDFDGDDSSVNEFKSIYIIKESYKSKDSINQSSTYSLSNYGFEINQMGDTNLCETEDLNSVKSIKNKIAKMKSTQNCGILFSPKCAEIEINQMYSSTVEKFRDDLKFKGNSFSLNNQKSQKKIAADVYSNGSQLYNYTLENLLTQDNFINHFHKQKNNIANFGLSTSKIVNGRFQHVWKCTYKNCMIFNSLQRQTCKNCLNPRWCHPPLCRRDMICINCGYINYKARLYCKKCKFIFIKMK